MKDEAKFKSIYGTKKRCGKCGLIKQLSAFNRTRTRQYIYLQSYCRQCWSDYSKTPKIREAQKIHSRVKRATRKKELAKINRAYQLKYPDRVRAHQAVRRAIKANKIKRTPCVVCGRKENIHAHHPDYTKPLAVIFLCPPHHAEAHKQKVTR